MKLRLHIETDKRAPHAKRSSVLWIADLEALSEPGYEFTDDEDEHE